MAATSKSDAQLNAESLARRERTHYRTHEDSRSTKAAAAVTPPEGFGQLLGWFQREWQADFPKRIHERGVEPESALGAPRLAGAMRTRLAALDEAKVRTATDYDPAHDTWSTGAAARFPMLDALERFGRKAPILRRYLEAVAYGGFDWRRVGSTWLRVWDGKRFAVDDEHIFVVTEGALAALWAIWSAGQARAGQDLA